MDRAASQRQISYGRGGRVIWTRRSAASAGSGAAEGSIERLDHDVERAVVERCAGRGGGGHEALAQALATRRVGRVRARPRAVGPVMILVEPLRPGRPRGGEWPYMPGPP